MQAETNPDGKLFGSVGATEIARAVSEAGAPLERQEIRLPDGPLRELASTKSPCTCTPRSKPPSG